MTTQFQIDEAEKIATELHETIIKTGVQLSQTHVDDWDDEGSFRLFITFKTTHSSGPHNFHFIANLRKIGWIIKQILKKHRLAIIQFVEMPQRRYRNNNGKKFFNGYENNYKIMDIRIITR